MFVTGRELLTRKSMAIQQLKLQMPKPSSRVDDPIQAEHCHRAGGFKHNRRMVIKLSHFVAVLDSKYK
jgi:hypothetical protein